jgi:outer membrane protein TolC
MMTRRVSLALTLAVAAMPLAAFGQRAPTNTDEPARPAVAAAPTPAAPPTLPEVLLPQPGGMTAEQAASRAIRASAQVRAASANIDAADAACTEAAFGMIPQISLSARYTRLSEITPPRLSFGSAASFCVNPQSAALYAGTTGPMGQTVCLNPRDSQPPPSTGGSAGFSFPVILDQFAVRATVAVPITDIPFRLARLYEAAGRTADARRLDAEATRAQAAADGRVAFYEYLRTQAQVSLASQAVDTVRRHREDLSRFVEAGTVARVELLRVEAQVAEAERLVVMAREGAAVAEANARIRLDIRPGERIVLGEALDAAVDVPSVAQPLIDQAWHSRPELSSLERQISALDANLSAVRAGYFPSVVAQANVDVANPNQRFVPNTQEWNTTWDATLQVQWSLSGAIQAGATASRVAAQREAVRAQIGALAAGVELEVRGAWTNIQGARAAIEASTRQLTAAEESYRVRRERFSAGSAVSSDLTDAENDLLRARFALMNAHVDLRVALARLRRAIGTPEPH